MSTSLSTPMRPLSEELVAPPRDRRPERWLEGAVHLAERFCDMAIVDGDEANWVTRRINGSMARWPVNRPTVAALPPGVYEGTAGVALYLARVHEETQDPRMRRVALAAMRRAVNGAFSIVDPMRSRGYYIGAIGVACAAVEAGQRLGEPALLDRARAIVREAFERRKEPRYHDIIFGAAGAIPALLWYAEETGDETAIELAQWHGSDLVRVANVDEDAYSWGPEIPKKHVRPMTGFSHGAAGYGWALSFLVAQGASPRVEAAARGAFRYERKWFDAKERAWRDLRTDWAPGKPIQRRFAVFWCHGSPGIGLSRIAAAENLKDARLRKEIGFALEHSLRTSREMFGRPQEDVCGCHGIVGNAECIWEMGAAVGDPRGKLFAEEAADWLLDRFGPGTGVEWPTAITQGLYPTLLTGVAGAGSLLLRLARPGKYPTILLPHHPEA